MLMWLALQEQLSLYTAFTFFWSNMDIRESVCSFDNLYKAMNKCKKGVTWKDSVSRYANNGLASTYRLQQKLLSGEYSLSDYYHFTIHEPKTRDIVSTKYKDRVFQRSLCDNHLYEAITKGFIYDNGACQQGRGTDFARKRLKVHIQKYYRKYGHEGYVLKCDLKNYFGSTPHSVVKAAIEKTIDDSWALSHVNTVIDSYDMDGNKIGLGLGSQITQLVQLLVLSGMDHCIKETMNVKRYIRYMDDFMIIHRDKDFLLECKSRIEEMLKKLGLTLNLKKTQIFKLSQGINFLGFNYRLTNTGKVVMVVAKDNIKKRKRKIRKHKTLVEKGQMTKQKADECYISWRSHAKRGNYHKVLKRMDRYYREIWNRCA